MGALVGGIYAMGKLDEYESWVRGLSQSDIFSLLDWNFSGGGLVKGQALIKKLSDLLGEKDIEELDIDFTAVAVNLNRSTEVWISEGKLFDAIRASIAIPGIFTPHQYRGMTLVDGGLLNPVPLAPSLKTISDLTVMVDVNAEETNHYREKDLEISENGRPAIIKSLGRLFNKTGKAETQSMIEIMSKAFEITQNALTRHHLSLYKADIMINIPHTICMFHEFHRAGEIIEIGRKKARKVLEDIEGY